MQCRRPRFDSWVRKIPWRREWLPAPVFWSWWASSDRTEQVTFSLGLSGQCGRSSVHLLVTWSGPNLKLPSWHRCGLTLLLSSMSDVSPLTGGFPSEGSALAIKKGKIQPNCDQGGQPTASVWVHFLPESPSTPVRTALIHPRGPGCPLHTLLQPGQTSPASLPMCWQLGGGSLLITSQYLLLLFLERRLNTEGWRTKRGGVGAAMGFKCTDHTPRESPAVHQIFTFGN